MRYKDVYLYEDEEILYDTWLEKQEKDKEYCRKWRERSIQRAVDKALRAVDKALQKAGIKVKEDVI